MTLRSQIKTGTARGRKNRRRSEEAVKRRYENAWDDTAPHVPLPPIRRARFARAGRIVILAPVFGALGAYIFLRRRR